MGLAASLLLHAGGAAALLAFGAGLARAPGDTGDHTPIEPAPDEPSQLGRIDAERASIAWLGVLENPVEGIAPESEVEQAALTPDPGEQPTQPIGSESTRALAEPASETPVGDPMPAPMVEAPNSREPSTEPSTEPITEPITELASEPTAPPAATPIAIEQESPGGQVSTREGPPEPELKPETETEPEPETESAESASEGSATELALHTVPLPPDLAEREGRAPSPTPNASEGSEGTPDSGRPGQESPAESDASMRRRAINYDAGANRPLANKGLEITTVRPDWPASVRQFYRPRNPYVILYFGADGTMKNHRFIREADGSRGVGIPEVEEPLINALYRWTAKGSAIDALDPDDPEDLHSVPIRILLSGR